MNKKIEQYIFEILYKKNKVIIPGIGTFQHVYRPPVINHAAGKISSPTSETEFLEMAQSDNEYLMRYIMEEEGCTQAQATSYIERFALDVRAKLDQGRPVQLDGIGMILQDSQGKIQFIEDNESPLSKQHYGLPDMDIEPVTRNTQSSTETPYTPPTEKAAEQTTATTPDYTNQTTTQQVKKNSSTWTVPIILGLVLAALLIWGAYTIFGSSSSSDDDPIEVSDNIENLNIKPEDEYSHTMTTEPETVTLADSGAVDPNVASPDEPAKAESKEAPAPVQPKLIKPAEQPAKEATPKQESKPVEKTPPATNTPAKPKNPAATAPKENKEVKPAPKTSGDCVVMVGAFQSVENIQLMTSKIKAAGFSVFQGKRNGLTTIGARVTCSEAQSKLQEIKKNINPKAYLATN